MLFISIEILRKFKRRQREERHTSPCCYLHWNTEEIQEKATGRETIHHTTCASEFSDRLKMEKLESSTVCCRWERENIHQGIQVPVKSSRRELLQQLPSSVAITDATSIDDAKTLPKFTSFESPSLRPSILPPSFCVPCRVFCANTWSFALAPSARRRRRIRRRTRTRKNLYNPINATECMHGRASKRPSSSLEAEPSPSDLKP